jgi:hypothetical protein
MLTVTELLVVLWCNDLTSAIQVLVSTQCQQRRNVLTMAPFISVTSLHENRRDAVKTNLCSTLGWTNVLGLRLSGPSRLVSKQRFSNSFHHDRERCSKLHGEALANRR